MIREKDIEILRKLFSKHNYIMTTAELTASKLYYADIKLIIHLLRRTVLSLYWLHLEKPEEKLILLMSVFMTETVPFVMCCEI